MATTIKLKNSVTTTNAPSSLVQGEVAINITDKKVWVGNPATTPIQLLGDGGSASFTSIAFGAGTVSNPSITFIGDTNTGIYSPAADTIAFTEGGAEAMRIDSSGNVGIGTSSPAAKFEVSTGGATKARITTTIDNNADLDFYTNGVYRGLLEGNSAGMFLYSIPSIPIVFGTNNAERMRIDSSGNVGIGTSSPAARFDITQANPTRGILQRIYNSTAGSSQTGAQVQFTQDSRADWVIGQPAATDAFAIWSGRNPSADGSERMRIDSSGNVGIGTTSISRRLTVSGKAQFTSTTASNEIYLADTSSSVIDNQYIGSIGNDIRLGTGGNERMRITSGGYTKISNDGTYVAVGSGYHEMRTTAADWILYSRNTNAAPLGILISYTQTPNGTGNGFLRCTDGGETTTRAEIRSNGGLANYSGNDVNLSDRREKTDFEPAKSYLNAICSIPVQTFKYIDQPDNEKTLGVVAQDVQAVAPELVSESNWGTEDEPKMRLSIYQTDLQYALMKCIQEQQAMIVELTNRIKKLEGAK